MDRDRASPRLYIPEDIPAHGILAVRPDQAHHIAHVLRLEHGDAVTIFDGHGNEREARIERISKGVVTLRVGESRAVDRESPLSVDLAQGISSGDRMDYTIQKAVELGVHSIQPLAVERSVVKLNAERAVKRVMHWQAIAIASCEQCGRNALPAILPVRNYTEWLAAMPATAVRLTLSPEASAPLRALQKPDGPILLLVGPEGGLSPREHADAVARGFSAVRVGPRILRTETAAVAALAAMQTLWGDF